MYPAINIMGVNGRAREGEGGRGRGRGRLCTSTYDELRIRRPLPKKHYWDVYVPRPFDPR